MRRGLGCLSGTENLFGKPSSGGQGLVDADRFHAYQNDPVLRAPGVGVFDVRRRGRDALS